MEHAVQSSYRMGFLLFNRQHPDYPLMFLLNTILGGYFGSRLMKNIREDKGYTYNIYSAMDLMSASGYFFIAAETSSKSIESLRKEIFFEIKRLKDQRVSDRELKMVKNYIFGVLLNYLDGPFNVAKTWKNIWLSELDMSYFNRFIQMIEEADPMQIMETANRYFPEDNFYEITCG
jgi:predicted Zn-dependent peptidase